MSIFYFIILFKSPPNFKIRMMLKICFLIVGIVFVVYILVGCSLTNAVEKRISDAILPSKYKKYADIHQDSISYEGNTMVKFKMMRGAFVNQKNELIVGDDNPLGYLKYDVYANVIDKIETKQSDGTESLLDGFYGDYLMDFKGKRYCSWLIDGDKSFKAMELVPHSEEWDEEAQYNFYLTEIKGKSPYYDFVDGNFYFFKDNKWSYFPENMYYYHILHLKYGWGEDSDEKELQEGKCISIFSRDKREFMPKEKSKKRDKIIPEYFKVEERDGDWGSNIGGGSGSYLTTWKNGIFFFTLQVNGQTFGLKNKESIYNSPIRHTNVMKDKTNYFQMYGGILENCGEYDVYTHPQLKFALFAHNTYYRNDVFIIKNRE